MTKKYAHLFFDLDHTLWDFEANAQHTMRQIFDSLSLQQMGISDFHSFYEKYSYHNNRLWERYRNGHMKQEELRWKRVWHTLLEFKIGEEKLAKQISTLFLDGLPERTILFPQTIEVLDVLKSKGYNMHLITNGFDEVQQKKVNYSGLAPYFGKIITSETSNSLKPHPEIFHFAFKETNAQPQTSMMIGDNIEADIFGAAQVGMDHIWVNHLGETPTNPPVEIQFEVKSLSGLLEIL